MYALVVFWESQVLEQIVRMNHTLCDSFGQFPQARQPHLDLLTQL